MKTLSFSLTYHTHNGERPELVYSIDGLPMIFSPMHSTNGYEWSVIIEAPDDCRHIRHAYQIIDNRGQSVRIEKNDWRFFQFQHRSDVCFIDAWTNRALDSIYHKAAFAKCIMQPRGGEKLHMELLSSAALLILHTRPPRKGFKWAVVGSSHSLGNWNVEKAIPLNRTGTYEWTTALSRKDFEQGFEYKYILVDTFDSKHVIWEEGNNRSIPPTSHTERASIVRQDETPQIDNPLWKGAGCVIPVFSLRSEQSMGVGDFGDLLTFIRWAASCELTAVQLLPINDTTRSGTWHDSYPYNGISVFALHPIYLDTREWTTVPFYKEFQNKAKTLNALPELDYEGAFQLKMEFARRLYHSSYGKRTILSADFKNFCEANAHWLSPYAQFCTLRDLYHSADFRAWPEQASATREETVFLKNHSEQENNLTFYKYLQFLLDKQMTRVHEEARQLGIILKGDIPIGISRDSVPAWTDGQLFHFNGQAGAPPDDFAVHGQNWGFPTYNWNEMAKDDYQWWRMRLKHMERFFDAYRIDHVLGFFRIWEVPFNQIYGLLGQFRPALPYTASEIHDWGLPLDIEQLCTPMLSYHRLTEIIEATGNNEFAQLYLNHKGEAYELKQKFRSQRYILENIPEGKTRQALLDLVCEVLFVRDADNPELFHPRVSAQGTHRFQDLSATEKEAFNRLHDHFFYQRNNAFWAETAMKKIPIITQNRDNENPQLSLYPIDGDGMLPCAEDLGMVPASVKGVLERLSILSLEIQRMPKEYGLEFGILNHNPYLSVATIATHDMPPLRLWWTQNQSTTQRFWNQVLHHPDKAPLQASPEVCEEVIAQHIQSPSMLCLLSLQDWLAISPTLRCPHPEREQINVPSNPNQYWNYRMHLSLEHLLLASDFSEKVKGLTALRYSTTYTAHS